MAKKKDEIRNLDLIKVYEKSYLVAENLSTTFTIVRYDNINTTEPGLVTKKEEPPRISL